MNRFPSAGPGFGPLLVLEVVLAAISLFSFLAIGLQVLSWVERPLFAAKLLRHFPHWWSSEIGWVIGGRVIFAGHLGA